MFHNKLRIAAFTIALAVSFVVSVGAFAQNEKTTFSGDSAPKEACLCDSLNIPVFLVDGVDVPDISDLDKDDISTITVVKDSSVRHLFKPRLGGVVIITTKSRKYLRPIVEEFEKAAERGREQRVAGEMMLR